MRTPKSQSKSSSSKLLKIFDSFAYPDMRILCLSTLLNQIAQGIQQVILGYMVLELTDSHVMVGVVYAARSGPNLLVGLLAGSLTDRIDRRTLMKITIWAMSVISFSVGILLYLDYLTVWGIICATFCLGSFQAFYMTARQVYVYDLVGSSGAVNGIAVISFAQRMGQVLGAIAAGGFIHWAGSTFTFVFMGGCYVLGAATIYYLKHKGQSAPVFNEGLRDNIVNYFMALKHNKLMLSLIISTAAAETFGFSHQVLLPILAQDVLKVGPIGLGVLTAFRFIGGAVGVIGLAAISELISRGKLLLTVLFLFGVGQVFMSFAGTLWVALFFVTLTNMMAAASDVLHQSLLQLSVPNEQRGRAMGSWIVGIGSAPLGQLQIGYISGVTSPPISLLINGFMLVGIAIAIGAGLPRLRKL